MFNAFCDLTPAASPRNNHVYLIIDMMNSNEYYLNVIFHTWVQIAVCTLTDVFKVHTSTIRAHTHTHTGQYVLPIHKHKESLESMARTPRS